MGNLILNRKTGRYLKMNNSWTDIVYSTLLLSGSELAKSNWEKELMIWIAEHDQAWVGLGISGMDINDFGWTVTEFDHQKEFVLKIIDNALNQRTWTRLPYRPIEDVLINLLNEFKALVKEFRPDDIITTEKRWRRKPNPSDLNRMCNIHSIYLHKLGETDDKCCFICNDK